MDDDGAVGEMQIKLDIAAAKLLTEEMKYADMQEQLSSQKAQYAQELETLQHELTKIQKQAGQARQNSLEQGEEVKELYMEIERLHEGHRAERQMGGNEKKLLEKEYTAAQDEIQILHDELEDVRKNANAANVIDMQAELFANQEEELKHTRNELKAVKKDIGSITKDFKDLADETERLEIELEAVTEDRDELLRRSVVYHNQAHSNSPEQKVRKQGQQQGQLPQSSLSESSRNSYEEQQHQAEIGRLRTALHEQEETGKLKDARIYELETMVESKAFDLDLSAIDVDNTSYITEDREARRELEERSRVIQQECSRLNDEMDAITQQLETVHDERDNLKVCLADAMQELEYHETTAASAREKEEEGDAFAQELMQIIKDKDAEIEQLTDQLSALVSNPHYAANSSSSSFRAELDNVVDWLNSSTRINGSPSIEMMIRDVGGNVELSPDDEKIVQALHRCVKEIQMKLLTTEANLSVARKIIKESNDEQEPYDSFANQRRNNETSSEASFEKQGIDLLSMRNIELVAARQADVVVRDLRAHIKGARDENQLREKSNEDLRASLAEAADLIKPLKDHVTRIEEERILLQAELASTTRRILELESEAARSSHSNTGPLQSLDSSEDQFGPSVQISAFDLRKKDDEIVELKIKMNQLRDDLKEAETELNAAAAAVSFDQGNLDEMPTPTKSNRGKDRSSYRGSTTQASNEEDDMKARMVASDVNRLKRELRKKVSAEETLKVILRDSANRLTMMSTQAENLANEKNDAENRIKHLEREKLQLQNELETQSSTSKSRGGGGDHTEEYKASLKDIHDRNDILSIEVSGLKADLKMNSKERKTLRKSLNDAVGMLNALRSHVESSEKERKKLKKLLRANAKSGSNMKSGTTPSLPSSATQSSSQPEQEAVHVPDPDNMENTTTILYLKSHIVEMEHEILNLEERIEEIEANKPRGETIAIIPNNGGAQNESLQLRKLKEQLAEAENAYAVTKQMLEEVSEINKEMLNDLRQTEDEAAEAVHELDIFRRKYALAKDEIDDAKYAATFALRKFESAGNLDESSNIDMDMDDSRVYGDMENLALTDCISQLERRVQSFMEQMARGGATATHDDDSWVGFKADN